jgi:hypothetical protein
MAKSVEFVRNEKLLYLEVNRQAVWLNFGAVVVKMLAYVEIVAPNGRTDTIPDVWEFEGDLNALWPLIGQRMARIVMDEDSFRLTFEDGTLIRCKNRMAYDFVGVGEKDLKRETSYPTVLDYLRDE